jgi:uncharacterized protein (TIGR00730 family)
VFTGSSPGGDVRYALAAQEFGRELVARGHELVYGGGRVGLMGVLADAVIAAGGKAAGVIPEALAAKEVAHQGLTDLRLVNSMHERKALMAELSDAFVALPGGFGTLDEFFEILTWAQLGLHAKPCGVLNVAGYFDPLLAFVEHAVTERFVKVQHRDMILTATSPGELLDRMYAYHGPRVHKWIDLKTT